MQGVVNYIPMQIIAVVKLWIGVLDHINSL